MEIKPLALTRLGIASKIQFFENTISIINANDPELLKVENQFTTLRNRWQELSALYMTDAQNPLSQEIFNLDLQRDECLLSAWLLIEGHSHSTNVTKRQAGEKLLRNFSLYANSASAFAIQKYDVETTNITNLINGWNIDAELMDAIDVLDLSETTTALAELNSQHNAKFLERNAMYAAKSPVTSTQKQAETAVAYNDLCKALNAFAFATPSPVYDKTISEINTLIENVQLSLKQKAGRKKEASSEEV